MICIQEAAGKPLLKKRPQYLMLGNQHALRRNHLPSLDDFADFTFIASRLQSRKLIRQDAGIRTIRKDRKDRILIMSHGSKVQRHEHFERNNRREFVDIREHPTKGWLERFDRF